MPKKKSGWVDYGRATRVTISGNRVPIRVKRPTLQVRKQTGANIRVVDEPGGYKGIRIRTQGGGKRAGGNLPGLPGFDRKHWQKRIGEIMAEINTKTNALVSGRNKYGEFVQKAKYRSTPLKGIGTSASYGQLARRRLRVGTATGGGEISLNPLSKNFALFHPLRFATNAGRWMINPLTYRAEKKEHRLSVEAADAAVADTAGAQLREQTERELKKVLGETSIAHKKLKMAFVRMGRGKITPQEYVIKMERFARKREELEATVANAMTRFETGISGIGLSLGQERKKRHI